MSLPLMCGDDLPWFHFSPPLLNEAQALVPQPARIQNVLIHGECKAAVTQVKRSTENFFRVIRYG